METDETREAYLKIHKLKGKQDKESAWIKSWFRNQLKEERDRRTLWSDQSGRKLELILLPDQIKSLEEAEAYFESKEVHYCDLVEEKATGRLYTAWYKVFYRRGRLYAYHMTAYNVPEM